MTPNKPKLKARPKAKIKRSGCVHLLDTVYTKSTNSNKCLSETCSENCDVTFSQFHTGPVYV